MRAEEYISREKKPTLQPNKVARALVENARTTFFSQGYRPTVDCNRVYRSEMDLFFDRNFLTAHLLESEAAKEWKRKNYVPVASSYYIQGLNKVSGAIFTGDNFQTSIETFPKDWAAFTANLGDWYDFISVWLLPNLISCPNDFLFFNTENGRFSVSKIPFEAVLYFDAEMISFEVGDLLYISDTERLVIYKRENGKDVLVSDLFHGYGKPMFMQFGGILLGDVYVSFFQSFIAHAELYTKLHPQFFYELIKTFATLVIRRNECLHCQGTGQVTNPEYGAECESCNPTIACKVCNGTGARTYAPSDVIEVSSEDLNQGNAANIVNWASPDMQPVTVKQSEIRHLEQEMKESLYIERSGVNQSGESKKMDNYAFVQFARPIALRLHTLAKFVADRGFSFIRSVGVGFMPYEDVAVVEPVELDYLTADDLRVEMENAKTDRDLFAKYQKQNYIKTFPSDSWLPFVSDVRAFVDAYSAISDVDFLNMRKVGSVSDADYYARIYFDKAVTRLLSIGDKKDYIQQGVKVFAEKVEAMIKAMQPQRPVITDNNGNII